MDFPLPPMFAVVGANDGHEYNRTIFVREDELNDLKDTMVILRFDNGLMTTIGDDCCINYEPEDENLHLRQLLYLLTEPGVFCVDFQELVKVAKPSCTFKSAAFDRKTFYEDMINWEIDDKEIKRIVYLISGDLSDVLLSDITCLIEEIQEKFNDPEPAFNIIHTPQDDEGKVRLSAWIGH